MNLSVHFCLAADLLNEDFTLGIFIERNLQHEKKQYCSCILNRIHSTKHQKRLDGDKKVEIKEERGRQKNIQYCRNSFLTESVYQQRVQHLVFL